MKLIFTILVLLTLFAEGKGKSGVQHANHKNQALNMRKLVKTAALHEDEALADFTGVAMPESFQFPVEVNLTDFEYMLEQRFSSINENVESLRTSLESLKSESMVCESGTSEGTNYNDWYSSYSGTVNFSRSYRYTPTLVVGILASYTDGQRYSTVFKASYSKTNSGFTYYLQQSNANGANFFRISYMACGILSQA